MIRTLLMHICIVTAFLMLSACTSNQGDRAYTDSNDGSLKKKSVPIVEHEDESDTTLFNPYHMPFYGGLTMSKIFRLYGHDHTASGPGNPFEMKCHQAYQDSATGVYHYIDRFSSPAKEDCDVYVSIWKNSFYGGDTNQRINGILIKSKNCKFSNVLPFNVGLRIDEITDPLLKIDSNVYVYEENDYIFLLYVHNMVVNTIYIKRLYCADEALTKQERAWFRSSAVSSIRRNKRIDQLHPLQKM